METTIKSLLAWCFHRLQTSGGGETQNAFFSSVIRPPDIITVGPHLMLAHKNEALSYAKAPTT